MNRKNLTFIFFLALTACKTSTSVVDKAWMGPAPNFDSRDKDLVERFYQIPERPVPPPNTSEFEIYRFQYFPVVLDDPKTGHVIVDLNKIKKEIIPELRRMGITVDEMVLEADGGPRFKGENYPLDLKLLNANRPFVIYPAGPVHQFHYVRVVLKSKGREVHVTDNGYVGKSDYPKIDVANYAHYPEAEIKLPAEYLKRVQFDPDLVRLAGQIQHASVIWTVSPHCSNGELKAAFFRYGSHLRPLTVRGPGDELQGWRIPLPDGRNLQVGPTDIITKGGAAFNQNSFYWDEHFLSEARANSDPKIAIDTLNYWIDAQLPDGSIGREMDFKGTPFQREDHVKWGHVEPNRDYFNPPISGWAWSEVARWNPGQMRENLPRVIEMMRKQRTWLLAKHAAYDEHAKFAGFYWRNRGSGRDNAPRPLDDLGIDSFPEYGLKDTAAPGRARHGLAVDLLAQYKMLLDHEKEFLEILGRNSEAEKANAEAQKISRLLNERYFNKKLGWYVDIIPTGKKAWLQTNVVTLAGFWPVAAHVASYAQVRDMVRNYLENPRRFGGEFFLPSLPRDNPYFDEGGHYWRGGGWPPDWEMVTRAVFEYGLREEAAHLTERHLHSMTQTSEDYAKGDTPTFLLSWVNAKPTNTGSTGYNDVIKRANEYFYKFYAGEIKNPAPPGHGTVFEFYGIHHRKDKTPISTYGVEVRLDDNTLHATRDAFAGWGALIPLRSAHYLAGLDAVPAYLGDDSGFPRWIYNLLNDPELNFHNVPRLPAFQAVSGRHQSFEEFARWLANEKSSEQLGLLRKGYVELNPAINLGTEGITLSNYVYNGQRFTVKIRRPDKDTYEVFVDSPLRIPLQLMSSPIVEVGGEKPNFTWQKK